jgi:type I restriction enzyme, S subunit
MSPKTPTTARAEEARPALVPKLRFPEFRGAGDWEPVTLQEASTPVVERVGERKLTPVSISAGIGFVPQAEKFGRDISGNQYQLYTLVKDGDFVFNKGNSLKFPQGCIYLLQGWGQVAAPNVFICFRLKNGYSNGFFQQCFEQNQHGRQLKGHITSGARSNGLLNISKETFFGVEIPTPSPAEQQKIADCLGSLDELIASQARKVDGLKTHKKGLMGQLFPREGETQPRMRFPEFQNASNWRRVPLGSLCIRIMDGTHFSPKSKAGPRPYLTSKNIKYGWIDLSNLSYISEEEHAEIYSKCPVKPRDVLLTKDGANTGNCALNNLDFEFSLLSSVAVLRANPDKLCQEFLFQSILSDSIQSLITESMSGQAITRITLAKIGGFTIPVTSTTEQQRIADCLTSLDTLITAAAQELETLKTHKKGLMQQLFPSAEVVEA